MRLPKRRVPETALVAADQRPDGERDGFGLARVLRLPWPSIPVLLATRPATSAHLPIAVGRRDKPWPPLTLLVGTRRALNTPPRSTN